MLHLWIATNNDTLSEHITTEFLSILHKNGNYGNFPFAVSIYFFYL